MKRIIIIFSVVLAGLQLVSCSKSYLEKKPLDQFDETVWTDLSLMQAFVNNIYYRVPHGFSELMMASLSDESILTYDGGSSNVTKSLITPSDISVFGGGFIGVHPSKMSWDSVYKSVRACNLFLEKVQNNTYEDEAFKNSLIGEVYFLRAYHYHNLVFLYGGVPIITKTYGLTDSFLVARNTFAESVQFIADDCDRAAALLPEAQTGANLGRATKGAALALKSRVLLFAASDLYHNTGWTNGYQHPELVSYTSGTQQQHWQAAKDAAKAVMMLNLYDLYKKNPSPSEDIAKNYEEIFLSKRTVEDIYIRSFIQTSKADAYNPGLYNNPNGYFGYGGNTPVSQLVDAFQMSDGSSFSWNNPAHKASPYANREPRFYANILYDGAKWRPRQAASVSQDPVGIIQTSFRQQADGSYFGGLDTRSSTVAAQEDGSYTGYYLRKFIDPTVNPQFVVQEWPWRFIRYTEILLNYAEACAELGEEGEALTYINMIRKRAGLPAISSSGAALKEDLRHERRIELMYEDQRFFDIRRWMVASEFLSENAKGVDIRYAYGSSVPSITIKEVRTRAWNDRSYFMPLKLDEINRNNKLIQNPLY